MTEAFIRPDSFVIQNYRQLKRMGSFCVQACRWNFFNKWTINKPN